MAARPVAILGCGYVGSALARKLVADGHDCVATTTTPSRVVALRESGTHPAVITLAETSRLHDLLVDRQCVFLTVAPKTQRSDYRDVYLRGADSLIQAMPNTAVRHVVYTSSTRVYGQDDASWVDEDSPCEPTTDNGMVLVETERRLVEGAVRLGATATVLRLSGIYGPGRDPTERIKTLAGREMSGGDAFLNLVHRDDIVTALAALLDRPYHGVLNLSDDCPTTRRTYYDAVITAAALPPIRWAPPAGTRSGLGKRVRNDRIKRALGLTLAHPKHHSEIANGE